MLEGADMRSGSPPLVMIGMPVYNEAAFVQQALDSLLSQDYPNYRILIADNASTDDTAEICSRVAISDERVSFHEAKENIGVAGNFQRVLKMASGRYFMWASGHDIWSKNLVSECVARLELHPSASIAFASSRWIDETGDRLQRLSGYSDTRDMGAMARFFTVLWGNMHPVLGLIRLDHLCRSRGMQSFAGADLILLSELVLMGDFIHVPQACWYRRDVRGHETHKQRMRRYTDKEYAQAGSLLDRCFPLLRLPMELLSVVWSARIPLLDRLCILLVLLPTLPARYVAGRR